MKTKAIEAGAQILISLPLTPNFLRSNFGTLPIAFFTDEQLREVGRAWTEALVEKARSRRMAIEPVTATEVA